MSGRVRLKDIPLAVRWHMFAYNRVERVGNDLIRLMNILSGRAISQSHIPEYTTDDPLQGEIEKAQFF